MMSEAEDKGLWLMQSSSWCSASGVMMVLARSVKLENHMRVVTGSAVYLSVSACHRQPLGGPQELGVRFRDVEAAVESVRLADTAHMEPAWIVLGVGHAGPSVDDVDEDAVAVLDRRGLDDGAQRGGRPAAAADHVSVIVPGDGQLEDDAAVVLAHFFDLDLDPDRPRARERDTRAAHVARRSLSLNR